MPAANEAPTIQAVERANAILETLLECDGAGVTELATRLDFSKSTVHNHLGTLEELGYVTRDGDEYHLGLSLLTFGGYARDHTDLFASARGVIDDIATETGELALLTTEYRGRSLYLYSAHDEGAVSTDSYLGIQLPMHCTGTGKAMLAYMDDERVDEIIDGGLERMTENTITDPDTLREELATIRERRVALDDEERIIGMRGIAAPIVRRNTGTVLGAITITGPTSRIDGEAFREDLPDLIRRNAEMIEVDLSYQ